MSSQMIGAIGAKESVLRIIQTDTGFFDNISREPDIFLHLL